VQLLRALITAGNGDYEEARSEINNVISSGRDTASAYYVRAAVAFEEKRLDAAAEDVDRALTLRDAFPAALTLQGRILEARGDTAEAKARYRKALQSPVENIEARNARKIADERLKALGVETPDVALNQRASEPVGCKRFLPATGTIINMDCDE
jgi:tetratricopeptide (TPR) repeat protein